MRHVFVVWAVLLIVSFSAAGLEAQVESHWLSEAWPWELLPRYLTDAPAPWSQQFEVPLASEQEAGQTVSKVAKDDLAEILAADTEDARKVGRSDATTLGDMLVGPRKAVKLAQAGKWAEAVAAGRPLLDKPKETYGDYTWDFLGSAVAWSLIQTGDYQGACDVHRAVSAQIADADVRQYHRRRATAIADVLKGGASADAPQPKPEELKSVTTLQGILRKSLADEARQVMRCAEMVQKAKTIELRLSNLVTGYKSLRSIQAVDPVVAQRLIGDFKTAVDSLVTDSAAVVLKAATAQHERLQVLERGPLRESAMGQWNAELRKLWAGIAEVKRLCRIHNYLGRLGVGGPADDRTPFDTAHELLYAPPKARPTGTQDKTKNVEQILYREVYKLVGGTDYQRRGKSLEEMEPTGEGR